jgi:hypothetical protein
MSISEKRLREIENLYPNVGIGMKSYPEIKQLICEIYRQRQQIKQLKIKLRKSEKDTYEHSRYARELLDRMESG